MLFFETRKLARDFAGRSGNKPVDLGSDADLGRRWAVKVL